ncbi:hypothetical protein [Streptomyces sennicomposti]|uniref:hypothetical protein n=1 Tax=Streptomyces sennicomposti TaxID=2873384 RepID=UPI001CA7858F|nr:hypothetical protein [Streptomyces sennicomposti]MBY8870027.1 hypothetical protein [Streptomyces sennicomposti]
MEAVTEVDSEGGESGVYVPCAPPGVPPEYASEDYAIVTDVYAHTYERSGDTGDGQHVEVTDTALHQALTDMAYRLTGHAYEPAECKAPRAFPEELPRYKIR